MLVLARAITFLAVFAREMIVRKVPAASSSVTPPSTYRVRSAAFLIQPQQRPDTTQPAIQSLRQLLPTDYHSLPPMNVIIAGRGWVCVLRLHPKAVR